MGTSGNGTMADQPGLQPENAARVAQITADAIRASNEAAVKRALDFADESEAMASELVMQAQSILDAVKDATAKITGDMRARAVALSQELTAMSAHLEASTMAYVSRCGAAAAVFEQHTKLLASPPPPTGQVGERGTRGESGERDGVEGTSGPTCYAGEPVDPGAVDVNANIDKALENLHTAFGLAGEPAPGVTARDKDGNEIRF